MNKLELDLFDKVVSGQLDIFRLAAKKRVEMLKRIAKMEKELVAKLATSDIKKSEKRKLAKFIKEAEEIVKTHYAQALLELDLPAISETVAAVTAKDLAVVLGPIEPNIKLPTDSYHAAVASEVLTQGTPQREWWARQAAATSQGFSAALRQGLASNETNQQLIARIVGKRGVGGVMGVARHQAAALVQTGVSSVANSARLASFKANSDLVIGVKQVSTLDGHTSDICVAYSGACWDLDGTPIRGNKLAFNNGPPRHFNCRSVLVPILKTFKELGLNIDEIKPGMRASDEGQIAANTTFDAFLKRKDAAYQDELLGPGRAELWRGGKITLRDLVSGDGRPLSLAELRAKAGFGEIEPKSSFMNASELENKKLLLELGNKHGVEFLTLADGNTGKTIAGPHMGTKNSVTFTEEVTNLLKYGDNVTVHHNHPSSSSLSATDLLVTKFRGVGAVWAHGADGSSYKVKAGAMNIDRQDAENYRKFIQTRFSSYMNEGEKLEIKDINQVYNHIINLLLHKKEHIDYSFELFGENLAAAEKLKPYIDRILKEV